MLHKVVPKTRTVTHAVVQDDFRAGRRTPATTAHLDILRFYVGMGTQQRRLSIADSLAACPSPFSVEQMLKDLSVQGLMTAKNGPRYRRIAAARIAELRGELFV